MLATEKSGVPKYRKKLTMLLNDLPESQVQEVYHYTIFIKERFSINKTLPELPSVQAAHLGSLLGLVELGGDALKDTEDVFRQVEFP